MQKCINCKQEYFPMRKGRCAACNVFLRRTGRERFSEPKPTSVQTKCKCGKFKDARSSMCSACYQDRLVNLTEKTCTKCKQVLPIESFSMRPYRGESRRRSTCKKCNSIEVSTARKNWTPEQRAARKKNKKRWEQENSDKTRRVAFRTFWRKRGFNPDEIESMYANKPESCQICGEKTSLVLDHCHKTNALRGWLCERCNKGIGLMRDSREILQAAIRYLDSGLGPICEGR